MPMKINKLLGVWREQPRSVIISHARNPRDGVDLSGIAVVETVAGPRLYFITFPDSTIKALGKVMPVGIGPEHQAYLRIVDNGIDYCIFCSYVHEQGILLWRQIDKPKWLKHTSIKKGK